MLFAKSLDELDEEWVWQIFTFSDSFVQRRHNTGRLKRSELEQFVSEFVCFVASRTGTGDCDCKPAKIFDEGQSQSDRDGPQLTDRKRRDGLVSRDESLQRLCVETRVGVCDQRECD